MKRKITFAIALLVIVFCLGTHVSELFDTWDNTPQTGNDIESTKVLVVLSVGSTLILSVGSTLIAAGILFKFFNALVGIEAGSGQPFRMTAAHRNFALISLSASPPASLRI